MRARFLAGYKRSYYMKELMSMGITKVDGKPLHELDDRQLKMALALNRVVSETEDKRTP